MKPVHFHFPRRAAPLLAALAAALLGLSSAGARGPDAGIAEPERSPPPTLAQTMFPDAPDGVDPVVTGPVSAQFRQRQQAHDCERAVWPRIPPSCYPR